MDPRQAFGLAVRRRRLRLGVSQEELAHRAGMDRTYVSGIERGRRNPTLLVIGRLAAALACDPARLLARPPGGTTRGGANRMESPHALPRPDRRLRRN
ncbi:MAG: helix-turn-helix transcriptional regulator [Alphaproteobacteria bacterium]|nr:helix-turn-helix transcriptional regulator [Alphaproteobacteria bacterium]